MLLVFGTRYAKPASWLIQIGQQPLLLLHGLSKNPTVRNICLVIFFGMAGLDITTNVGAFQEFFRNFDFVAHGVLDPDTISLARYVGYIMCVVVVFSEEALILLSGVAFHLIGMIAKDFGSRAPKWFTVDAVQIAGAASGAHAAGIEMPSDEEERPSAPASQHTNGDKPNGHRSFRRGKHARSRP